jgi:hypothetical protein
MKMKITIQLCAILFFIPANEIFTQNVGDSAYINVNKIYLPFNNRGVIADVTIFRMGSGGIYDSLTFLFAGGFMLSGSDGGTLWTSGTATACGIEHFLPGTYTISSSDPRSAIYKVRKGDPPFGLSWHDWIDAVELGADFYDGDGDGVYNPVDLNGNNQWDPDEDKPDLLLDETYWCVFNDGLPSGQQRWQSEPQGIEIRQTIFAEASASQTGNAVFVRYRIKNTGLVADTLKDVYLSMYADADIGDFNDDLFGCDTIREGVYFYNNEPDMVYGNQVPSFMMDMLTGPYAYIPGVTFIDVNGNNAYENGIDTPLDTALNYLGPIGITIFPGAMNLEINSAVYQIGGHPILWGPRTVNEVRNYSFGLDRYGEIINPCSWPYGEVRGGVPCNAVNPYYWCSGDPVSDTGWISNQNRDVRGNVTAGPFTLVKNREVEVLIGYEIDSSSTPIGGITAGRNVSDAVQIFYETNFGYPIVSVEDKLPIVSEFKLEQYYPNPFNPSTKIKFTIHASPYPSPYQGEGKKERFHVSLKVYDVLGNEIATLVNEEHLPGEYEVEFNASDLASGIYFYTLKADYFLQTKKMILLR